MADIETIQIKYLDNKPKPFKKLIYPQTDPNLPRPYCVCLAVGMRGSGKTYAVTKMISNFEKFGYIDPETGDKVAIRTILFSPTYDANPVFTVLNSLDDDDIINEFTEEKLDEVLEDIKREAEETEKYLKYKKAYLKFQKTPLSKIESMDPEDLQMLFINDFKNPKDLPNKPRYPNGVVNCLILDDCLGSNAFKNSRKNSLVKAILNSRHMRCQFFITAQNLKAINKSIRANTSVFVLFKFASKKIILEDLYESISGLITIEDFERIYEFATDNPHDALVVDTTQKKENVFRLNQDKIIIFKKSNSNNKDDGGNNSTTANH